MLTTPVSRFFPLTPVDEATVALALDDGSPLVVTAQAGRGRTAVVATAASLRSIDPATGQPWTAMPAWPSFLPIVRELIRYVSSGSQSEGLLVGEAIHGAPLDQPSLQRPDEQQATPSTDTEGGWSYESTDLPGVYRFGESGQPPSGAVAVNVHPAEGDLRRVQPNELPSSLRVRRVAADETGAGDTLTGPAPLHRWLLYGALALVLTESGLACWFGRGSV